MPSSGVYVPMKLLAVETVVKIELAAAVRPSASLAVADIWYFVPRSSCSFGFQLPPSADIEPARPARCPTTVIFTSVSFPSLTFTPVELMDAPVEPSLAEMAIFATDVLAPPLPPFSSSSSGVGAATAGGEGQGADHQGGTGPQSAPR